MHDTIVVPGVVQRRRDRLAYQEAVAFRKMLLAADERVEIVTIDVLHRIVPAAGRVAETVASHDAGMVYLFERLLLLLETLDFGGIAGIFLVEDFQRHKPVVLQVERLPDMGHAAGAETGKNLETRYVAVEVAHLRP